MVFSSLEFIFIFIPIVFVGYFTFNAYKLTSIAQIWLILSSLFFYSYWNINYLPLLLISIVVNFTLSKMLMNFSSNIWFISKKILLLAGIAFNLFLLIYFKYMDFFIVNLNLVANFDIALLHYALPLAISFFTLQQIAFIIDSYEGLVKEKSFINYTMFVTFFPQLIAGPIVHHKEMMSQFASHDTKVFNRGNMHLGVYIFSIGLFKKVILADTFAIWSDEGFINSVSLNTLEAWATSTSYSLQLYFDFSGYSDMAVGLALMFNIVIPHNFNSPFQALSIIDFWKRWHMTLTNFIASYIYTPLLMSLKNITLCNAMIATFVTMQIAGIWHGPEWKYIVFGTLHSIALVVNHLWRTFNYKIHKVLAWGLTFIFINITLTIFRGDTLAQSYDIIYQMFDYSNIWLSWEKVNHIQMCYIIFGLFIALCAKNVLSFLKDKTYNTPFALLLFLIAVLQLNNFVISSYQTSKFIYFNF